LAHGKSIQTEDDKEQMQSRWVKMAVHVELEHLLADCLAAGEDLPVELEIEGALVEAEGPSAEMEADRQASALVDAAKDMHGEWTAAEWEACEVEESWRRYQEDNKELT
jgi:hypothetical protein